MAEQPMRPVLQQPPGYRDPTMPAGSAQPPRRPVIPASFRPKKRSRSCCRFCCCCVCITLFLLIFLLLVAAAVFYLWFDPKLPGFRLASFRVSQLRFSDDSDGATSLSASTVARVEMKNPNSRLAFYYGNTAVEVSVGEGSDETGVGSTKVGGFKQGTKNTTTLKVETSLKNQLVDDGVAKRLAGKFKNKELVVSVTANSKVGLGVGRIKIGMLAVSLRCGGVSLKKLDSDSPKCNLNTLKWINIKE